MRIASKFLKFSEKCSLTVFLLVAFSRTCRNSPTVYNRKQVRNTDIATVYAIFVQVLILITVQYYLCVMYLW